MLKGFTRAWVERLFDVFDAAGAASVPPVRRAGARLDVPACAGDSAAFPVDPLAVVWVSLVFAAVFFAAGLVAAFRVAGLVALLASGAGFAAVFFALAFAVDPLVAGLRFAVGRAGGVTR